MTINDYKKKAAQAVLELYNDVDSRQYASIIGKILNQKISQKVLEEIPTICKKIAESNEYTGATRKLIDPSENQNYDIEQMSVSALTEWITRGIDLGILENIVDSGIIRENEE